MNKFKLDVRSDIVSMALDMLTFKNLDTTEISIMTIDKNYLSDLSKRFNKILNKCGCDGEFDTIEFVEGQMDRHSTSNRILYFDIYLNTSDMYIIIHQINIFLTSSIDSIKDQLITLLMKCIYLTNGLFTLRINAETQFHVIGSYKNKDLFISNLMDLKDINQAHRTDFSV